MAEETDRIVDALVSAGLVDATRRDEAAGVLAGLPTASGPGSAPAVGAETGPAPGLRSKLGEIAGYAGAALVVAAGVVFLAQEWSSFSDTERVAWISGMAIVLALAGAITSFVGTGFPGLREESGAVRRRLAGTLYTGTAITAALAVGLEVEHIRSARGGMFGDNWSMIAALATLVVVGIRGYLAAPTVLGLLPIAVGSFTVIPTTLELFNFQGSATFPVTMSLLEIAVALLWWGLSEIDVVQPRQGGLAIAMLIGLIGAQMPVMSGERPTLGYLLTALVAVGAFVGYAARPAWAYLGAGVIAVTLVVPEALNHWTSGSLGTAGSVLLAGIALLGASLLSFRLRRGSTDRGSGS